jgi:hypothetical protein
LNFTPHSPRQEQAVFSDKKILAYLTGIQVGKTTTGALRQKIRMHTYTAPDDAFIITAPTYKILQQSTLPAFLRIMDGLGDYSKADAVFRMHGGGTCYMRTGTEPDSSVGITNVRGIWGDEAGKYSRYFWENIVARSAIRDCQIDLTSSPYALNWIYKDIVRPKQRNPKALPHVDLIQQASWDNPYMPKATIDHARATMDRRRFNALFGGQWERMAGLVYDIFDEVENQCDPFEFPEGTRYVGGIDWGFTEPFVFKVRALLPNGWHIGVSEFYKSGITISAIGDAVCQRSAVFGVEQIYCDPSQPGMILELNRLLSAAGVRARCIGADNDVRVGIDRHYELVKTRRMKYLRGTHPQTLDEYDSYHYPDPDDVGPDDNVKEAKPVGQNDHALDADRYITISTYLAQKRHTPVVAQETPKGESQHSRIERLKRTPRVGGRTEDWSA